MQPKLGFWRSLRRLPGEDIFSVEVLFAVLIGFGGGAALLAQTNAASRIEIAGDYFIVIGPLLGVVFAAFALVISMMTDSHLRALTANSDGIVAFLRPFIVAIGLQVGALLTAVLYRAAAEHLPAEFEGGLFLGLSFLFILALLDVVALARAVLAHGVARERDVVVRDLEEKAKAARQRRAGTS